MKPFTYLSALLLIATGLVGYFAWEAIGADKQSVTALIPAFVGIPMLLGAIIAEKSRAVGMHIAVVFGLLGALAGLGRIIPTAMKGELDFAEAAPKLIAVMTVICLVYTVVAIQSFIAARKAKAQASA